MSSGQAIFRSGNWTGFYLESHRSEPGWMHLHLACDPEGAIRGEGVDYVGPWTLSGKFSVENSRCNWIKKYIDRHCVSYEGALGADGIIGVWSIKPFLRGPFQIWPEGMSHLYEKFLHRGTTTPNGD